MRVNHPIVPWMSAYITGLFQVLSLALSAARVVANTSRHQSPCKQQAGVL